MSQWNAATAGNVVTAERERQRVLMRQIRAAGRDLVIPRVANERRRRLCSRDSERFCRTYMPDMFWNPFTDDQRDQQNAILDCARYGGNIAVAGPRGGGKTTIIKGTLPFLICNGLIHFPLFIGKNQDEADLRREEVKGIFESNDLLAADWPEVCEPIRALEGWGSRARLQTVNGVRTRMVWAGKYVIFPTVPGSKASGIVMMAVGREGSIRGKNVRNVRPDLVVIDDFEDEESINSPVLTERLFKLISTDIAGLAGPGKSLAVAYLCTIARKACVADRLTDREKMPTWRGRRYRAIVRMPDDPAKDWDRFIELFTRGFLEGDDTGRAAHAHYLKKREAMDAGAVVGNPYRFNRDPGPDGKPLEASNLENCFMFIAQNGWPAFNSEMQNDPPAEEAVREDKLTWAIVAARVNGRTRGVVPEGFDYFVGAIDVHARALYSTLIAFKGGTGYVVDYAADPVHSPIAGGANEPENAVAVENAIVAALMDWRDRAAAGWIEENTGQVVYPAVVLIDSGWKPDAVYTFCREFGGETFRASKGDGSAKGQTRYTPPARRSFYRKLGNHWFAARDVEAKVWRHHIDSDHFKLWVHTAFQMPPAMAGSLTLFGDDAFTHKDYGRQIEAQKHRERFEPGKGMLRWWDKLSVHDHWLDTTAGCVAAAVIAGMKLLDIGQARQIAQTAEDERAAEALQESAAVASAPPKRSKGTRPRGARPAAEPEAPPPPPAVAPIQPGARAPQPPWTVSEQPVRLSDLQKERR